MVGVHLFALLPSGILNECVSIFNCLPVYVFYIFAVTSLANLLKSFARICARPLLDGRSRLTGESERRDSFLTLLDGPTFFETRRVCGAEPFGLVYDPVGVICPRRELPIASWVFYPTGTSTVELD